VQKAQQQAAAARDSRIAGTFDSFAASLSISFSGLFSYSVETEERTTPIAFSLGLSVQYATVLLLFVLFVLTSMCLNAAALMEDLIGVLQEEAPSVLRSLFVSRVSPSTDSILVLCSDYAFQSPLLSLTNIR
jgi:hypothetical protein